ncbi:cysteine and O-acetyl-L-serine efflux system [Gammaproteobacteria bacterium]|nr:cysteine and O-acetyl-L-serine efflux system [Gammaproteobacteria bacterium]
MPLKHIGLAIIVAAAWGFNFIAVHFGVLHYPPIFLAALRFISIGIFAVFIPRPTAWRYLLCVGLSTGTLQFMFMFSAINQGAPIGLASLIVQVQAFSTAIFASIFLSERIKIFQWIGILLGLCGILVIALARDIGTMPPMALILLLLGALSWSIGNIFMKVMGPVPVMPFLVWMSVIPPIPLLLLSLYWEGFDAVSKSVLNFEIYSFISLLYIVLVSTLIGYGLWNWLLAKHPASVVGPYSLLVPVFGMSAGIFILGEKISTLEWIGAFIVLLGLLFNVFGSKLFKKSTTKEVSL